MKQYMHVLDLVRIKSAHALHLDAFTRLSPSPQHDDFRRLHIDFHLQPQHSFTR
jgi:hypothetical protein